MKKVYPENEGEEKEQENMKIADRFITAMFLPKEYGKLLKLKIGKLISYLVLLILLASVIQYAIPALGAIAGLGGIKNIIINELPEFAFQDGTFFLGEKVEQSDEETGIYLLVDTSADKFTRGDIPANTMEAIMVSKTNILVYNNVTAFGGIVQEDTFDRYKDLNVTNESVAEMTPFLYVILFFAFVVLYVFMFARYLLVGLFYALIIYLLSKTMMMEFTFGKVYKMALYAQSVGVIAVAVTYCINSSLFILAGSAFNMLITVIIMNKALVQMQMEASV